MKSTARTRNIPHIVMCGLIPAVWIKTNNVELSEAINSMFRWYLDASICYVYLSDVSQGMIGDVDNQVRASD